MTASLPKLKILAVDDSRSNLQLLKAMLHELGHEVVTASDGQEALALFESAAPDLVFMDIIMPLMGGLEAAEKIRALPSEQWVPIIFLSALDRDENLVGGLEAGGDDFLSKPVNFVVLQAKVRSMQRMLGLQHAAHDSLRHLQTVSDNVLEAIITTDSTATITSCNRATEDLFGWRAADLIGQNVRLLCPEPQRSEHDRYVREYTDGGPPRIIGTAREVIAERRDGSQFPAELRVSEVRRFGQRMFIGVISDISERHRVLKLQRENAARLQSYYERSEAERALAVSLMERQLMRRGLDDAALACWLMPAQKFSGDALAAARTPDCRLCVLLADATGHGLAASISTLPLLTLFYRLAPEGVPLAEMVREINQQLRDTLPVGHFVGATLACLDFAAQRAEIWVGGMPPASLIDGAGRLVQSFAARELPLGIVDSSQIDCRPETFTWSAAQQLVLCSDGLLEAENAAGEPFEQRRLLAALAGAPAAARQPAVQAALAAHLGSAAAQDDVSLMLIDCPAAG